MNPDLIPNVDASGIPAPSWVFITLMLVTLVLHFIAVGYVVATSLVQMWFAWRGGRDPQSTPGWILERLDGPLPVVLSFAITLGVAPLLFVQVLYGPYFYTANILIGFQWIGVIPMLIIGFYTIYLLLGGRVFNRRIPRVWNVAGRIVIFLCMLYILVTHTANAVIVFNPEDWLTIRENPGSFAAIEDSILLPRMLHNIFATLIIGGLWFVLLGYLSRRNGQTELDREGGRSLMKLGAHMSAYVGMVQVLVGLWLLFAEETVVLKALVMFGEPVYGALWWLGVVAALGLVMHAFIATTTFKFSLLPILGGLLVVTLLGMFSGREGARQARLAAVENAEFTLAEWTVRPQLSSLFLFLFLFVLGLALLYMMIRWMIELPRPALVVAEGPGGGVAMPVTADGADGGTANEAAGGEEQRGDPAQVEDAEQPAAGTDTTTDDETSPDNRTPPGDADKQS